MKNGYKIRSFRAITEDITNRQDLRTWVENRTKEYESYRRRSGILSDQFDTQRVGGITYVSQTIELDSEGGFLQWGNAPNLHGGVYTLATCRHDLRGLSDRSPTWSFDEHFSRVSGREDIYEPNYPVLIFNSSSKSDYEGREEQYISNVAFVTHAFSSTEAYADFLLSRFTGQAISHRFTRVNDQSRPREALKYGDCHADLTGKVGPPPKGHPHHEESNTECGCSVTSRQTIHEDNRKDHLRVLALTRYWHAFEEPVFANDRGCDWGAWKVNSLDFEGLEEVS